jgi:hypothetical protein
MGDRVLIQVKNETEFSPVAYGHWSGSSAPDILRRLQKRMVGRSNDVSYAFARLVQEMVGDDTGNTSFGAWNAQALLTAEASHGGAGCVIIDVSKPEFTYECFGGYLILGPDGFPVSKYDMDPEHP